MPETAQHQAFSDAVKSWLRADGVDFTTICFANYEVLELPDVATTIILDFMTLPYEKPQHAGFQFGIDLFLFHSAALQSRIKSISQKTTKIYARQTLAKRIDKPTAEAFFNQNHLAGFYSCKFKLGLFFKAELVAAITFAAGRNFAHETETLRSFELIGFCQKSGCTVVGGLSKLLSAFCKDQNLQHIATKIDTDWATGKGYEKVGFTATHFYEPLAFGIDWKTGVRCYPSRNDRENKSIVATLFPFTNGGNQKFEHFYGR